MNPIRARSRMTWLMLGCFALAGVVLGRAVYLQIIGDPRLERMAKRQFEAKVLVRPRRGMIVDRNGEPLAINIEAESLAANPSRIRDKRALAQILAKATDVPVSKLAEKLAERREFTWIKRHLSPEEIASFKKWRLVDADGDLVEGLWLVKESRRTYPHGLLSGHVLGDVNIDSDGVEGVELWQNDRLRGKVVSVEAVKDAMGRPTFIDAVAAKHVKDGEALALTIDASLQFSVEEALRSSVRKHGARGGTAIVMDAASGEILAMANEPSFNPNEKGTPTSHRRNRAVTDGYEPGSTMKPILLAGALSNGFKLTDQIWGERGSFSVQGKRISEAETHEKFEWLTLKKIIQVSSNVGAAKLALKLGADKYLATLRQFGFGIRSGMGFPGEIQGKVPPRRAWQPLSLANIGFGQGVLTTPIQMIRAYGALANGGWLVQPRLLKDAVEGEKVEPPRRILSAKAVEGVVEALQSATEEGGTGIKARPEGYRLAGKTGTAQVVDSRTGKYSRSRFIASFIGFPIGVEPKLVIFTALDEPRGVYYAAETAAPLFRDILQAAANRFSLPTTLTQDKVRIVAAHPVSVPVVPAVAKSPAGLVFRGVEISSGERLWKVPALKGLTPREALRALQGHPFKLEFKGAGVVRGQIPEEGKTIAEGGAIRLQLGEP